MLSPQIGTFADVLQFASLVLLVILCATALGFALRATFYPSPSKTQIQTLDGASVLAFSISYGLQAATLLALRGTALDPVAGPLAIGAGNRNIALFLVALPAETLAPVLIFIGCWQLPMYLTPILLPKLYTKVLQDG
jgi:ACR3 family arsenite transporter